MWKRVKKKRLAVHTRTGTRTTSSIKVKNTVTGPSKQSEESGNTGTDKPPSGVLS